MAVLSVGDAGQDVFAYDETVDGPFSLIGEGNIGDVFSIVGGGVIRPTPIGGGGVGDVSRNGATIDNRIARWHGTDAEIQNTAVTVNDSGDLWGINNLSMLGSLIVEQASRLDGIITAGSGSTVITTTLGLLRHQAIDSAIAGSGLSVAGGVLSVDAHAPAAHTIASHDTTATGAELNSLTNNSMVDTLHRHSELSASDGSPDKNFSLDATGKATLASGSLAVPVGTAALPTYAFAGFLDDGMYHPADNQLGWSTAGVLRATLRATELELADGVDLAISPDDYLKLWGTNNSFNIRMSDAANHHYGPVTSHSIKISMDSVSNRGVTIGNNLAAPVHAFAVSGDFQHDGDGVIVGGLEVQGGPSKHKKGFGRMASTVSIAIAFGAALTITDEDDLILVTTGTSSILATIVGGFDGQEIVLSVNFGDSFTLRHNGSGTGLPVFTETGGDITCTFLRHYHLRRLAGGWICTDS